MITENLPSIFKEIGGFICVKKSEGANLILVRNKGQVDENKIFEACLCELYLNNNNEEWREYEDIVQFYKLILEGNLGCDRCGEILFEIQPART